MGSVIDYSDCPKCNTKESYSRNYYYKSGEEYCCCTHCGYTHNVSLKRTEDCDLVREKNKELDLNKGNVWYVGTVKNYKQDEEMVVFERPVLPADTVEDILNFINLPFVENDDKKSEKFKDFLEKVPHDKESVFFNTNIYLKNETDYEQLWYNTTELKINNGILEVWEAIWENEEYGGIGVLAYKQGYATYYYPLDKNERLPADDDEIWNDIIFASHMVDGELVVVKDTTNEN